MISGVTKEIGGESETFRLTTRAMMAIEDRLGAGIVKVIEALQADYRVSTVASMLAACANDGKGRDLEWAQGAIDQIGLEAAGGLVGQIAEAAFPEASGKNVKRAARTK